MVDFGDPSGSPFKRETNNQLGRFASYQQRTLTHRQELATITEEEGKAKASEKQRERAWTGSKLVQKDPGHTKRWENSSSLKKHAKLHLKVRSVQDRFQTSFDSGKRAMKLNTSPSQTIHLEVRYCKSENQFETGLKLSQKGTQNELGQVYP